MNQFGIIDVLYGTALIITFVILIYVFIDLIKENNKFKKFTMIPKKRPVRDYRGKTQVTSINNNTQITMNKALTQETLDLAKSKGYDPELYGVESNVLRTWLNEKGVHFSKYENGVYEGIKATYLRNVVTSSSAKLKYSDAEKWEHALKAALELLPDDDRDLFTLEDSNVLEAKTSSTTEIAELTKAIKKLTKAINKLNL
jgi:hypothetical protein